MLRSPIKPKRDRPRRNDGRVQHARIKPTAKADPTAEEARHHARLRELPCIGCGRACDELHHPMKMPDKVRRRDHRFVVPLCAACHRGSRGVHGVGSEAAFERERGLQSGYVTAWAAEAWRLRGA